MDLLLVGLGNPSRQYDATRHNVGFDFLDTLAAQWNLSFKRALFLPAEVARVSVGASRLVLVKPQTYMNLSGDIFPRIFKQVNMGVDNLLVVCDNMDLPPGVIRLKKEGGSGGQKGLQSIIDRLGTKQFYRLFVGIGRPHPSQEVPAYVLSRPSANERKTIQKAFEFALHQIEWLSSTGEDRKVIHEINSYRPE